MTTSLEKLQNIKTRGELAHLLGYKPSSLSYIINILPHEDKYYEFTIPKKNGDTRVIKAPIDKLKIIQRRLADLLNKCFEETCINSNHKKSLSHGFRKKHSIITNARNHKNKRYVFNIDLKDFFPSINFGRVRGFLIKNSHFNLEPEVATAIAQIACDGEALPQGSPCSPIISNLIAHLLDIRMVNLAKKTKCTYSRYADDLTFSTNIKEFPKDIAYKKNENDWVVGKVLKKEIEKVGFTVNKKKVSMQYKLSRQITTGLIVNKKVNIKREYYKKARAMCHSLFQTDKFYIGNRNNSKPTTAVNGKLTNSLPLNSIESDMKKSLSEEEVSASINQLDGILNYIYYVKEQHNVGKTEKNIDGLKAITDLYSKFLWYKYFYCLNQPLILCEGKTDIIYLKCALKQLATYYPEFICNENGDANLKIDFLNFTHKIKSFLNISAGTSGLSAIMGRYKDNMKSYKGNGKKHPVIIFVDDDSGSVQIKKKLGIKDIPKSFYHFVENLYVVFVPPVKKGEETEIEDLFNKKILETKIKGKTFDRQRNIETSAGYGKFVFAENVIKNKQDTINFNRFKKVFDRFKEVLADYQIRQLK